MRHKQWLLACYIIIHIMLARIVSKRLTLFTRNRAAFGSSHDHHDHHDHHDYHVEVNRDRPWVKFNSVILEWCRIIGLSALTEFRKRTTPSSHLSMTTPTSTSEISPSSLSSDSYIMILGSTRIRMSHITRHQGVDIRLVMILSKTDSSTLLQFTSVLEFHYWS